MDKTAETHENIVFPVICECGIIISESDMNGN